MVNMLQDLHVDVSGYVMLVFKDNATQNNYDDFAAIKSFGAFEGPWFGGFGALSCC